MSSSTYCLNVFAPSGKVWPHCAYMRLSVSVVLVTFKFREHEKLCCQLHACSSGTCINSPFLCSGLDQQGLVPQCWPAAQLAPPHTLLSVSAHSANTLEQFDRDLQNKKVERMKLANNPCSNWWLVLRQLPLIGRNLEAKINDLLYTDWYMCWFAIRLLSPVPAHQLSAQLSSWATRWYQGEAHLYQYDTPPQPMVKVNKMPTKIKFCILVHAE